MWLSLLPGVRHLRAPLAAGYLWLATVWLAMHERWNEPAERGPAFDAVFDLRDTVSAVGLAVAVSFVAYVIGSLSQPVTTFLGTRIALLVPSGLVRTKAWAVYGQDTARDLGPFAARDLSARGQGHLAQLLERTVRTLEQSFGDAQTVVRTELGERPLPLLLMEDLPLVHRRLAGKEETRELFSDIDRTQSEAELRLAIWLPLAVLIMVFAVQEWGWSGFLSLIPAVGAGVGLALQGTLRLRAANDSLVDAVRANSSQFPTLERVLEAARLEDARQAELRKQQEEEYRRRRDEERLEKERREREELRGREEEERRRREEAPETGAGGPYAAEA